MLTLSLLALLPFAALPLTKSGDDSAAKKPAPLPASVDLRPQLDAWGLGPRGQGARPTCSVFATTAAIEFALAKSTGKGVVLSEEFLNWASNEAIHDPTDGGFFHDLLKGFEVYGLCPEPDMPYRRRFSPARKPSDEALKKAAELRGAGLKVHWLSPWSAKQGLSEEVFTKIKQVIASGYPVAAGSDHSRLFVGYVDDPQQPGGGTFLVKDSGAAAYNSVTYQFAREKVSDTFWVEAPSAKKP